MKRKLQQFESTQKIGGLNEQFGIFITFLQEELVGPEGSKYADKIKQRIDKALGTKSMVERPSSLSESAQLFLSSANKADKWYSAAGLNFPFYLTLPGYIHLCMRPIRQRNFVYLAQDLTFNFNFLSKVILGTSQFNQTDK